FPHRHAPGEPARRQRRFAQSVPAGHSTSARQLLPRPVPCPNPVRYSARRVSLPIGQGHVSPATSFPWSSPDAAELRKRDLFWLSHSAAFKAAIIDLAG